MVVKFVITMHVCFFQNHQMRELAVLVNAASNKLKKQKQDKEEKLREKAAAVPAADEQQLS